LVFITFLNEGGKYFVNLPITKVRGFLSSNAGCASTRCCQLKRFILQSRSSRHYHDMSCR